MLSKQLAYKKAKQLAAELGYNKVFKWIGTTKAGINFQLDIYNNLIKKRNDYIYKVRRLTRKSGFPVIKTRAEGTDAEQWKGIYKKMKVRARVSKRNKLFKEQLFKAVEEKKNIKFFDKLILEDNYNEIFKQILDNNKNLTDKQANKIWYKLLEGDKVNIHMKKKNGDKTLIPINDNTKTYITDLLKNGVEYTPENEYESDVLARYSFMELKRIKVKKAKKPKREFKNKDGSFFAYINTTNIDLSRYQIYDQKQAYDNKTISKMEHCLIHALRLNGVEESEINALKLAYKAGSIRRQDLNKIAQIIKRNIILHIYIKGHIRKYNHKYEKDNAYVEISLFENHYFITEPTQHSLYSSKHYNEVKNLKDFHNIFQKNGTYKRKKGGRKATSLELIKNLYEDNHFKRLDLSRFTEASTHKDLKNLTYLENIEKEQKQYEHKEKKQKTPNFIYFADCETFTQGEEHKLFLLGMVTQHNDNCEIWNVCDSYGKHKEQNTIYKFLNSITNKGRHNAFVYFHNLKYDYTILERYLYIINRCEKDNVLYSLTASYRGKKIKFVDSYKIIPFALSKFKESFDLDNKYGKKDGIAYEYYNENNNNKRIKTEEYKKYLSIEQQKEFTATIENEKSYDEETKTFNPLEYYKEYLKLDCLTLKHGVQKFNKLISEVTNGELSVYDYLTISSLSDSYFKNNGSYEGVYEISANLRDYVQKAIYGGRTATNPKFVKRKIEGKIVDFDGVSLYPSAIARICDEGGIPKGPAVKFNKDELKDWEKMKYCILTVKITKVNKIQQMPMIAVKGTSTEYTNSPPLEPVTIDKLTLQDYIKFHHIEYEILEGVYWNSGGNTTIGELITELCNKRVKYKKTNKPLADTIKLMANSAYGKTMLKKYKKEKKIIKSHLYDKENKTTTKDENFIRYLYNNHNTITQTRRINNQNHEISLTAIDTSYNRGHIGCMILSMSKRIMNEVFDTMNTHKLINYYTDTDSIHMDLKDVEKLALEYKNEYNKELIGKQLGQFHTDFNLKGAVTEIYATESIFLGKKAYIDKLESTNEKGEIITGYHYRLKGVTNEGIIHQAKQYTKNKEKPNYMKLYETLAEGKEIKFILNPFDKEENKQKVLFDFNPGTVKTKKEFKRTVKF